VRGEIVMAARKKTAKMAVRKAIPGYPGLYTFVDIPRNPAAERHFLAKVMRNAKKLKADLLTSRAVF
jgi:hypothetical protein